MPKKSELTERQLFILRKLLAESKAMQVWRIDKTQAKLCLELGITRQALSNHLRELRKLGLLNTGRGFIDLTERAARMLEGLPNRSFVFVKIEPRMRNKAYREIKSLDIIQAFRVTGDVDVVMIVDRSKLDKVLKSLSTIDGVKETSAHLIIAPLVEGL